MSKTPDTCSIQLKKKKKKNFSLQIFCFRKELWASSSVSIVKLSLKDHLLMFLNFLSHNIFFLALKAMTIAVVNCKTSFISELSVTCNALWEQFKMVDVRKTVSFFKILYIHTLSHNELLY